MKSDIMLAVLLVVVVSGCVNTGAEVSDEPENTLETFLEEYYSSNPDYEEMFRLYSSEVQNNHSFDEWEEEMRTSLNSIHEAGGDIELLNVETINITDDEAILRQTYRIHTIVEASKRDSADVSMIKEDSDWKIDETHFLSVKIRSE